MENLEEVQQILERFARLKQKEIPKELDQYMRHVAQTGDIIFPWINVKYLLREKLLFVIKQFYDASPNLEDIPQYPNVDPFNYESMKSSLLERLDSFAAAPFTIQRLYELLIEPRKQYNRIDKFMRALEKNILVVSTIDSIRRRNEVENGNSLDSLVNDDLSLDVNVDIDLENENVFNIETPNGTAAVAVAAATADTASVAGAAVTVAVDAATSNVGNGANGTDVGTITSTHSNERKEKHGIDEESLPSPKKLKLDNVAIEQEDGTKLSKKINDAHAKIDTEKLKMATETLEVNEQNSSTSNKEFEIVEQVKLENENEELNKSKETVESNDDTKQSKTTTTVEVEKENKTFEQKEVNEKEVVAANGVEEFINETVKEFVQKAAETTDTAVVATKEASEAAIEKSMPDPTDEPKQETSVDESVEKAQNFATPDSKSDVIASKAIEDDIDEKLEAELLGEITTDVSSVNLRENIGQSDDIIDAKLEAELLEEIAVVDEQLKTKSVEADVPQTVDGGAVEINNETATNSDAIAAIAAEIATNSSTETEKNPVTLNRTEITTATVEITAETDTATPIKPEAATPIEPEAATSRSTPVVEKTENIEHESYIAPIPANIIKNINEADTTVELSIPAILPPAIEILDSIDDDEVAVAADEQQIMPTIPMLNEQPMDIVPLEITNVVVDEVIMSETAKDDSPTMDVDDTSQEEAMDH